jgi:serine protease AprX
MKNLFFFLFPYLYERINKRSSSDTERNTNKTEQKQTEKIEKKMEEKKIQVIVNYEKNNTTEKELEEIGTLKYKLPMINSYVLEIPESEVYKLKGLSGVVKVEQDAHLTAQMHMGREMVNAKWAWDKGIYGEGVTVGVLDTGVYPHNDLIRNNDRIVAFKDFVNEIEFPYDDNGHGTHVAGIIAGDGWESKGKYAGISPKTKLVCLKVLNKDGTGNISDVLAGLQWIIDNKEKYNIRIINLSVGMEDEEGEQSALVKGVNAAWDNDIIVVCAAGNNGPKEKTITTPGISRKVITVGSADDSETVSIFGDDISNYSGRGPTKACIKKPDVVAPGSNITSCNSNVNYIPREEGYPEDEIGYINRSGTSMATPIVTGCISLILCKHENICNKDIKLNFKYSSNDLGFSQKHQGWGMINIRKIYENIERMNEERNESREDSEIMTGDFNSTME